jgi:hypothetical protein
MTRCPYVGTALKYISRYLLHKWWRTCANKSWRIQVISFGSRHDNYSDHCPHLQMFLFTYSFINGNVLIFECRLLKAPTNACSKSSCPALTSYLGGNIHNSVFWLIDRLQGVKPHFVKHSHPLSCLHCLVLILGSVGAHTVIHSWTSDTWVQTSMHCYTTKSQPTVRP